jgi:hypothetical protein
MVFLGVFAAAGFGGFNKLQGMFFPVQLHVCLICQQYGNFMHAKIKRGLV